MSIYDFCQKASVSDLFEVIGGARFPRELDDNGIPVVRGRDVAKLAQRAKDLDKFRQPEPLPARSVALVGDILIQKIGSFPSSVLVSDELQGCLVGDTVLILRPRSEDVATNEVFQFLSSAQGQAALSHLTSGAIIPQLTIKALSALKVPILPSDLSRRLEEAREDEARIRRFADEILGNRKAVFLSETRQEAERLLEELKSVSTVIGSSLSNAEDLQYQVRNFYPLPLAYPYRLVEAEFEPIKIIGELYRTAEGFTAFLASVALALAAPPTGDFKKSLRRAWGGKGATFGNWLSILGKTTSLVDGGKGRLFHSVNQLLGTLENSHRLATEIQWLVDRRDDFHHRDWPVGKETSFLIEELQRRFEVCLQEVNFLVQHPLRLVLDYDAVRNANHVLAKCLDYSGDHPVCRRVQEEYEGTPKKDDLYILQDGDDWIPLYPFVSVHYCPRCKTRETFFIDNWGGPGEEAHLKSFERLHGEKSSEIGQELTRWFGGG